MHHNTKINICKSILDELSVIGYLDNWSSIMKASEFIWSELDAFNCGGNPIGVVEWHFQNIQSWMCDLSISRIEVVEWTTEIMEECLSILLDEVKK